MSDKEIIDLLMCLKHLNSHYNTENINELKNDIDIILNVHILYLINESEGKHV